MDDDNDGVILAHAARGVGLRSSGIWLFIFLPVCLSFLHLVLFDQAVYSTKYFNILFPGGLTSLSIRPSARTFSEKINNGSGFLLSCFHFLNPDIYMDSTLCTVDMMVVERRQTIVALLALNSLYRSFFGTVPR